MKIRKGINLRSCEDMFVEHKNVPSDNLAIGYKSDRLKSQVIANVGDGWFMAAEKPDYIQAIGLSSAKFQHTLSILRPIMHSRPYALHIASSRSSL